jgi:pyruvate/2-oxoglutarate dehydrogenase complex dihydrolipoamide dehydrogenase (E3) component
MPATADPDVLIVGAGPSGLAAARKLLECGAGTIAVLDRDDDIGGLPRFCGHFGFGFEYSARVESGPAFVRRLRRGLDSPQLLILTQTTALSIGPGPYVDVTGPKTGPRRLRPRAVLIATGIREMPRGGRLIPGDRPQTGILTTGLLQQMVARGVRQPVGRMVVVGSEHVAFSAVLTARHAGGRAVAIVESGNRIQSFAAASLLAKYLFGVAIHRQTDVAEILGRRQVEAVLLAGPAGTVKVDCDSVLMTAGWRPDAAWVQGTEVEVDARTGGPAIDQMMRTTLPGVFAAGNVLRGVESSGVVALEGERAAACIAAYLKGSLSERVGRTRIEAGRQVQYAVPQRWASHEEEPVGAPRLRPNLRAIADHDNARVRLRVRGEVLWQSSFRRLLRSRRVPLSLTSLEGRMVEDPVVVELAGR